MVRFLLSPAGLWTRLTRSLVTGVLVSATLAGLTPSAAARKSKPQLQQVPELLLEGGRKLTFERTFSSQRDVKTKKSFWNHVVDFVAGEPDYHGLIRPYSIVTDSQNRIIVTDPGAAGIHVFDFQQQKYKFLSHLNGRDPLQSPQCVAVDRDDNIYVTDSESGKIFVFERNGKFRRVIGSLKGGEGYFKRPTGIAVDSEAQRIYVTDTLRNKIYVMDMQGSILQTIGKTGEGDGEFNFPTELRLVGQDLIVVDAMNFRVQVLDRSGIFKFAIGSEGDGHGELFRPKGIGVDSEGHIYVVDGLYSIVQVFDRQKNLLYYFGGRGTQLGDFQLPTGLFIDRRDQIFVVDSYNRRIEVFQYQAIGKQPGHGGAE
jgi:DNA-binding beta-propeller fold protein YncE